MNMVIDVNSKIMRDKNLKSVKTTYVQAFRKK